VRPRQPKKQTRLLLKGEPTAKHVLIIFAKYPEPGKVKTRLSVDIGEKKAIFFYKLFVETVVKNTESKCFERRLFYSPQNSGKKFSEWLGNSIRFYPQKGSTLGERLSNAFRSVFDKGAKKVIVIGTDAPLINNKVIEEALEKLKKSTAVIGPSYDGGYYLLGLSVFYVDLFMNIDWSTPKVFEQTVNTLRTLGINHSLLDKQFDIDTGKDLNRLKENLKEREFTNLIGLA